MNNILLRTLVSLILAPIFILLIYYSNVLFIFLLFVILIASFNELKFLIKKNFFFFILIKIIIIIFLLSFYNLRGSSDIDFVYLIWIISIVWLSDIGGLCVGRLIEGPKLSKLSPNKTWSGFFGSLIFSQNSYFILYFFDYSKYSIKIFVIQIVLSLISILGDLFFSFVKRKYLIKDFSNFIPGHGGILDRIDGLVFVIIFYNLFKYLNVY